MSTYVSDNFLRADGSLGSNWSTPVIPPVYVGLGATGSIQLKSHAFAATSANGGQAQSVWAGGQTFANDQYAQYTVAQPGVNTSTLSITACSASAGTSTYTYTLSSGAALIVNQQIYISGMQHSGNNSTVGFIITALGSGTFSVLNASPGANESGSTGTGIGPADNALCLVVRGTADGQNSYFTYVGLNSGYIGGSGTSVDQRLYQREIWKNVNGVFTGLAFTAPTTIPDSIGDVYRFVVKGTTLTLYKNNVSVVSTTDSSLTSGIPGIAAWSIAGPGEWVTPTVYTGANSGNASVQATNFVGADTFVGGQQLASDNFQRGAGGLGANWTTNVGTPVIASSGVVEGTTLNNPSVAHYNAVSFPNDQYSESTILALANNNCFCGVVVRAAASAQTYYELVARGPLTVGNGALILVKLISGVQSALTAYTTGAIAVTGLSLNAGDVVSLVASGTTISGYLNGILIIQGTDASIASGSAGIQVQPNNPANTAHVTNWDGGSAVLPTSTFSPAAGSFGPTQSVTIINSQSGLAGFAMYYTTDGSTPTTGSTLYTGPITVGASETIKVLAVATGYTNSLIGSAAYVINGALPTPSFSPVAGSYGLAQSVTITSANSTAIYYTTDGSVPTTGSTLYSGPVTVSVSETLKALATAAGWSNSAIGSAAYTINTGTFSISGRVKGTRVYESGTVLTTPPTFGNVINWAPTPAHFGDVDNAPADNANPVSWSPTPPHFCDKLPSTGVTVTLSGAASGSTTTDQFGNYSFDSLAAGTYTVTPSQTGYTFAPLSRTFTINDSVNGINFASS
jgi:hypothetical protein